MEFANLTRANLARANFVGTEVVGANFLGAIIDSAVLVDAIGISQQQISQACANPEFPPDLPPGYENAPPCSSRPDRARRSGRR